MQFFARFSLTKMLGYGIIAKFCPARPSPGRPICQVEKLHKNKSFSALIFYSSKYSIIRFFSSLFFRQFTNFIFSSFESLSLTTLNLHQKGFIPWKNFEIFKCYEPTFYSFQTINKPLQKGDTGIHPIPQPHLTDT